MKTLAMRHSTWPFKTLAIPSHPEVIPELLAESDCMLDAFTLAFRKRFSSEDAIQSESAQLLLHTLDAESSCDTVTTEREHASNLRRAKGNAQTHALSMAALTAHMALRSGQFQSWEVYKHNLVERGKQKSARKQTREQKKSASASDAPRKARKLGAWKAFVSERSRTAEARTSARFKSGQLTQLAADYRALSPEQRQRYIRLGNTLTAQGTRKRRRSVASQQFRQLAASSLSQVASLPSQSTHSADPPATAGQEDMSMRWLTMVKHHRMLLSQDHLMLQNTCRITHLLAKEQTVSNVVISGEPPIWPLCALPHLPTTLRITQTPSIMRCWRCERRHALQVPNHKSAKLPKWCPTAIFSVLSTQQ